MKKTKRMMAAVMAAGIGLIPFSAVTTTAMSETTVSSGNTADTAATTEDSLNISEEIKDNFRKYEMYADPTINPERRLVKDFSSVMRLYNVPLRMAFTDYDNIDDVMSSSYVLRTYYIVEYEGNTEVYNEQFKEFDYTTRIPAHAMERFKDKDFVSKYISPTAELKNIYYLSGEASHMGTAIYYRTSEGDYVYYHYSSIGENLFTIDDFCAYQQAIKEEYEKYPESGGGVNILNVWDLSKYPSNDGIRIVDQQNIAYKKGASTALLGDANCDHKINVTDAVAVLQYIANAEKYPMSEQARFNADIDGEEGITGSDATAIQRIDAGIWDES